MSLLTGVNADAVRPALRTMEKQVQELFNEIYRYCTGPESEIAHLTMTVTSGNRHFYTPKQLNEKNELLQSNKLKVKQVREPREKTIEELRAKILLVENLKTQSLEDMMTISGAPKVIIELIDEYLEKGFTIIDTFTRQPHYYA